MKTAAPSYALPTSETLSGLILAGGLGRRMGGQDKGLLSLDGQPLAAHIARRLAPQVADLRINANRHADAYAALGYPVIADDLPDYPGPLAGLHAGLSTARQDWLLTVPCDSPFLPDDLASRLIAVIRETQAPLASARADGREHPVFCLCHRSLLPALDRYLKEGGRQVRAWQASVGGVIADFPDGQAFRNWNTPEDWR